jgi:hypothetical protein
VLLGLILVWLFGSRPAASAPPAPFADDQAAGGSPPDLSKMTPRDQFDRLYNRVMRASEQGDTATVARFSPMALMAYGNLPTVDADARYHAAMLRLHAGDMAGAEALADSILAGERNHLFGHVVAAAIARFRQDQAALQRTYAAYLGALDVETKAGRPEYEDHRSMLDAFTKTAREAQP